MQTIYGKKQYPLANVFFSGTDKYKEAWKTLEFLLSIASQLKPNNQNASKESVKNCNKLQYNAHALNWPTGTVSKPITQCSPQGSLSHSERFTHMTRPIAGVLNIHIKSHCDVSFRWKPINVDETDHETFFISIKLFHYPDHKYIFNEYADTDCEIVEPREALKSKLQLGGTLTLRQALH